MQNINFIKPFTLYSIDFEKLSNHGGFVSSNEFIVGSRVLSSLYTDVDIYKNYGKKQSSTLEFLYDGFSTYLFQKDEVTGEDKYYYNRLDSYQALLIGLNKIQPAAFQASFSEVPLTKYLTNSKEKIRNLVKKLLGLSSNIFNQTFQIHKMGWLEFKNSSYYLRFQKDSFESQINNQYEKVTDGKEYYKFFRNLFLTTIYNGPEDLIRFPLEVFEDVGELKVSSRCFSKLDGFVPYYQFSALENSTIFDEKCQLT